MHIDRLRRATESKLFCIQKDKKLKNFPYPNSNTIPDWRGVYSSIQVPVSKRNQWTVTFRVSDENGATTNQPVDIEFLTEKFVTDSGSTSTPDSTRLTNHTYFAKANQMVSKSFEVDGPYPFLKISALGSDAVAFSQFFYSIGSHVFNIFEENAKTMIKPYLLCYRQNKLYGQFISHLSTEVQLERRKIGMNRCINEIPQSGALIPHFHDVDTIPMWLSTNFDDIYGIGPGYKETVQDRGFMSADTLLQL